MPPKSRTPRPAPEETRPGQFFPDLPETPPAPEPSAALVESVIEGWQFVDKTPTTSDVERLLTGLGSQWGIAVVEYADFVHGLPSTPKMKVRNEAGVMVERYHDVITLYMSVAGRVAMLRAAQEQHEWLVDAVPEPTTPTGIPGYLRHDDRLVYREIITIEQLQPVYGPPPYPVGRLGTRTGTAWVPASGGSGAAKSNPYEKVETSAHGRALGRWGFGVLPGSGIATLEEMLGVETNRQAAEAEGPVGAEDLIPAIATAWETLRQARGQEPDAAKMAMASYIQTTFKVDVAVDRDEVGVPSEIDYGRLKPGMLRLLHNNLVRWINEARATEEGL